VQPHQTSTKSIGSLDAYRADRQFIFKYKYALGKGQGAGPTLKLVVDHHQQVWKREIEVHEETTGDRLILSTKASRITQSCTHENGLSPVQSAFFTVPAGVGGPMTLQIVGTNQSFHVVILRVALHRTIIMRNEIILLLMLCRQRRRIQARSRGTYDAFALCLPYIFRLVGSFSPPPVFPLKLDLAVFPDSRSGNQHQSTSQYLGSFEASLTDRKFVFKYKYVVGYTRQKGQGTGPTLRLVAGSPSEIWKRQIDLANGGDYSWDRVCGGHPHNYSPEQSATFTVPAGLEGSMVLQMIATDRNIHVVGLGLTDESNEHGSFTPARPFKNAGLFKDTRSGNQWEIGAVILGSLTAFPGDRKFVFKYKYVVGYTTRTGQGVGPILRLVVEREVWKRQIDLANGGDYPWDKNCGGHPHNYSPEQSAAFTVPAGLGGDMSLQMTGTDRNIHVVGLGIVREI